MKTKNKSVGKFFVKNTLGVVSFLFLAFLAGFSICWGIKTNIILREDIDDQKKALLENNSKLSLKKEAPSKEIVNQDDKWVVYQNEKENISFEHPSSWKISKQEGGMIVISGPVSGRIKMTSIKNFRKDFSGCLQDKDESTCKRMMGDVIAFEKKIQNIKNFSKESMTHNKASSCPTSKSADCEGLNGFDDCSVLGGYLSLRTIKNKNRFVPRTIGFCGVDMNLNYYYASHLISGDHYVEINFDLFPVDSPEYEWATSQVEESNCDKSQNFKKIDKDKFIAFSKNFKYTAWNDDFNELVKSKIAIYDKLVGTFTVGD